MLRESLWLLAVQIPPPHLPDEPLNWSKRYRGRFSATLGFSLQAKPRRLGKMVTVDREARTEEEEAGQSLRQYPILSRLRLKGGAEGRERLPWWRGTSRRKILELLKAAIGSIVCWKQSGPIKYCRPSEIWISGK